MAAPLCAPLKLAAPHVPCSFVERWYKVVISCQPYHPQQHVYKDETWLKKKNTGYEWLDYLDSGGNVNIMLMVVMKKEHSALCKRWRCVWCCTRITNHPVALYLLATLAVPCVFFSFSSRFLIQSLMSSYQYPPPPQGQYYTPPPPPGSGYAPPPPGGGYYQPQYVYMRSIQNRVLNCCYFWPNQGTTTDDHCTATKPPKFSSWWLLLCMVSEHS